MNSIMPCFIETPLRDPQLYPIYIPPTVHIPYGRRTYMSFGHTGGNVGQQGTNSGNVAVGHQWNGRK